MIENSHIEIDIGALSNNLALIKSIIGENRELISVVKGNAYGHGIQNFVPSVIACGIKSFAVFSAFEAKQILELNLNPDRIVIMGNIHQSEIGWAIDNDIEFYVFDFDRLDEAINQAKKRRKKARIHVEVETGLNRTGFNMKELKKFVSFYADNADHIIIQGICSHLAGAENIGNFYRIKKQINRFNAIEKLFHKHAIDFKQAHLACSAAIINYPKTMKDMARIGIMQYGLWPSKEVKMGYLVKNNIMEDPLKPVLSWKSRIMSIKSVEINEYVGYGTSMLAETNMKIATVPVGYADGFARALSNQGKVLINNQRLDVIATVNMNLFIVDVSNLRDVKIGDEVVLIGKQGEMQVSVASFSEFSNQLNYELLTRLPNNIPRIIT